MHELYVQFGVSMYVLYCVLRVGYVMSCSSKRPQQHAPAAAVPLTGLCMYAPGAVWHSVSAHVYT